jgi:outer membrane protein assembly factor BamD (BamD/ComL family)
MHDKEIQYFTEALLLVQQEFFVDAIGKLKDLIGEYPNSDLADDAQYNIGLCYFQLNQFEKSVEAFNYLIANYPEGSISVLDGGSEFGKTTAKAYLGIMNCYLGLGKVEEAEKLIPVIKNYSSNTYVMVNDIKKTFEEIAIESLKLFKHKID